MAKLGMKRGVHRGANPGRKRSRGKSDSSAGGTGDFGRDSFFQRDRDAKKRRRAGDEELYSSEEDDGADAAAGGSREQSAGDDDNEAEEDNAETADEKRLRVARAYLDKIRDSTKVEEDENDGEEDDEEGKRGARDTLVADLLKQQQLEDSGRAQRKLASRVVKTSTVPEGKNVSRRHRQTVTAVTLTEDDSRGFSASKDGLLVQWDIETGQSVKYAWPLPEDSTTGSSRAGTNLKPNTKSTKLGSKHILALTVSSDGRYLAAGGLDRTVHLWDTRSREHIQAFPGHKGAISCLVFRHGTQQLMSGSFDRSIKLWSVDDRSYIDTLYGHQSEVLAVDCLRQERVLSAGRDRTLRVWKVPEESQLVFRGHAASMDCCCFLSNGEFLSGSDDGSLALWNTVRKKPVCVVKNAHGLLSSMQAVDDPSNDEIPEEMVTHSLANGHANGNGNLGKTSSVALAADGGGGAAESWIGAVAVCSGSDLVASGAGDGMVRLWALEETNRSLRALCSLPVKGFVNSLALAHSGRFLLAGVGQEPRLGRWGRISGARNGVVQHVINLSQ